MKPRIISYCQITNDTVLLNGKIIPIINTDGAWLDNIYRTLQLQYLKFFKMDNLSKAGFLASELIFNDIKLDKETPKTDIAIVCFNSSSSLNNDILYQKTIQDTSNYYPSPSIFVYTLANIVIGEIAIRNKIMGETSFYVTENFSPQLICDSIKDIFNENQTGGLLCGWIEYFENNCDIRMMYIENKKDGIEITNKNITNLFK